VAVYVVTFADVPNVMAQVELAHLTAVSEGERFICRWIHSQTSSIVLYVINSPFSNY
jgi:hypothetical protein